MKSIISSFVFYFVLILWIFPLDVKAQNLYLYTNRFSDILVANISVSSAVIYVYGGATDHGPGSASDCLAYATLQTKDGFSYSGRLSEISSDITNYLNDVGQKKAVLINLESKKLKINEFDASEICGIGVDFTGIYDEMNKNQKKYHQFFNVALDVAYKNFSAQLGRENYDKAKDYLLPFATYFLANEKSSVGALMRAKVMNDYGYVLQRTGSQQDAIKVFKKVIVQYPSREVAYLNIADSYWAEGLKNEGTKNYEKYLALMQDRKEKIPPRVFQRINEK